MGEDKYMLNYHGKPQCYHVYELLQPFCNTVAISCNSMQTLLIDQSYNTLEDLPAYADAGPATGLLTAFESLPENDFLVIGCDYPFLTQQEISLFLKNIPANAKAASFYDEQDQRYQPVLAWYSSTLAPALFETFQEQNASLQQFLKMVNASRYIPIDPISMLSVDEKTGHAEALRVINTRNV